MFARCDLKKANVQQIVFKKIIKISLDIFCVGGAAAAAAAAAAT